MDVSGEKLQKVLAQQGIQSRRTIEEWIKAKRVSVNGTLATLGQRVLGHDSIAVDGIFVLYADEKSVKKRLILYHKPVGEICTRKDKEGRPTVFDKLPVLTSGKWISVGRLDVNSSGLLLFTTDGELANRLMHPSFGLEREYLVRVQGEVSDQTLHDLTQGVMLEDGNARFESIQALGRGTSNRWFQVVLKEGRNREVRRLWQSKGLSVSRLKRIRYGNIMLPRNLPAGGWCEVEDISTRAVQV